MNNQNEKREQNIFSNLTVLAILLQLWLNVASDVETCVIKQCEASDYFKLINNFASALLVIIIRYNDHNTDFYTPRGLPGKNKNDTFNNQEKNSKQPFTNDENYHQ